MVIDSSAVLAILFDEPDARLFAQKIEESEACYISAANILEASIIIDSRGGPAAPKLFDQFVKEAGLRIEPVTSEQYQIARVAYKNYGKGRHAAGLNFGDCFAYALAKSKEMPLLFKGDDFSQTDIQFVSIRE